jgi:chitodextrinase
LISATAVWPSTIARSDDSTLPENVDSTAQEPAGRKRARESAKANAAREGGDTKAQSMTSAATEWTTDTNRSSQALLTIEALKQSVAELQSKSQSSPLCYRGVWDVATQYVAGNFVTHSGSLWHAEVDTRGVRPGEGSACWKLAVKAGRPGKDGRDGRDLTK